MHRLASFRRWTSSFHGQPRMESGLCYRLSSSIMSARFRFVDHVGSKEPQTSLSSPRCHGSVQKRHTWSRTSPRLYLYISCLLVILSAATGSIIHDQSSVTNGLPWAVESSTDSVVSTYDLTERKSKSSVSSNSTGVLECFQVTQPVLSTGEQNCTVLLMNYSFANSYGAPFVGTYTPPTCSFDRVILNMTVTSRGRQFDRLGKHDIQLNDWHSYIWVYE